jgi:hypothetical protein
VIETYLNIENDEILSVENFNPDGSKNITQQFNKSWDSKLFKEIDYASPKGKRILHYNQDETIQKIEYYNAIDSIQLAYIVPDDKAIYYHDGNAVQNIQYKDNQVKFSVYKSFDSLDDNTVYFNILRCTIIETYPISFDLRTEDEELKNVGIVKKLKLDLERENFVIYTFNADGSPIQKTYFKKENKPKERFEYNTKKSAWVEL